MTKTVDFPEKLYLSGADCFFLAMEKHYKRYGNTGNTCHLSITVQEKISKTTLEKLIRDTPFFSWLSKIRLVRNGFFGLPYWHYDSSRQTQIEIYEFAQEQDGIPKEVLRNGIFLTDTVLCRFSLVDKKNGYTEIIFSWHHILMDAKGAETLIRMLGGDLSSENVKLFPEKEKKISIFKALYILHFSKEFVKKSSKKPLVQLTASASKEQPIPQFKVIELSEEQTRQLDKNALDKGAKISKGSFYLASATKAINDWLVSKGNTKGVFWVPVPQNRRKKGVFGPVVSNLQSFMFYRIPREKLRSITETTTFLTGQMVDLIRFKRPEEYAIMSDVLRYLPSSFYYYLIKGPGGGSIASFLYSDPGVNEFNTFCGKPVLTITNYPPGTYPPGLMIIFERFNNRQKVIINYTHPIITTKDLTCIEANLVRELLS